MVLVAVVGIVLLALLFDFTNGFHDAANSTSTVVATRAMKPRHAVYMAAFFNFAALFVVGTAVANTVAKTVQVEELGDELRRDPGRVWPSRSARCSAAIFWNYFTWSIGMPSSSSHALIGGLVGAGPVRRRHRRHQVEQRREDRPGHRRSPPWSPSPSPSSRCSSSGCCRG